MIPKISDFLLAFVLAGGLLLCGYFIGSNHKDDEWRLKWAEQSQRLADAERAYIDLAKAEELRRMTAINEVSQSAQTEIDRARADADAARAAADGLRNQAKRLAATASKACGNPGTAATGKAAGSAGLVLADVLGRTDDAAGELAAALDRSRIAGMACEKAYDSLTP